MVTQSESIKAIATAINLAQKKMSPAKKDAENPFFHSHYSTLASVVETFKEYFSEQGLSFVHTPGFENGEFGTYVKLLHVSGEWLQGFYKVQAEKPGPQAIGAAFTYARRYSLSSIAGIPSEDNDAEDATERRQTQKAPSYPAYQKTKGEFGSVTDAQMGRLRAIARDSGYSPQGISKVLFEKWQVIPNGIISTKHYDAACGWFQSNKVEGE